MIHIDRRAVPEPKILSSATARREAKAAEAYYAARSTGKTAAPPPRLTAARHRDVRAALAQLFHGKCAYCESSIAALQPLSAELHRPRMRAMALDGTIAEAHYWWLASDWSNLLPACLDCDRSKATRFPVRAERAKIGTIGVGLTAEKALLLDPCLHHPEHHLLFAENGSVLGTTPEGKASIEILSLNRSALLQERERNVVLLRAQLRRTERLFGELEAPSPDPAIEAYAREELQRIRALLSPSQPYAGLHRQFINRWFEEVGIDFALLSATVEPVRGEAAERARLVTPELEQAAAEDFKRQAKRQQDYSVAEPENLETFYTGKKSIEWVELVNFRAIERLELTFPPPTTHMEPWLMLLGENGTGKSSVLQAVALALMGEEECRQLGLDASMYVNRAAKRGRGGRVRVKLTNIAEPLELRFRRSSKVFDFRTPNPKVLLLAYGATRLLNAPVDEQPARPTYIRIKNLFDPRAPLSDVESWLLDAHAVEDRRFAAVADALKRLLVLLEGDRIMREDGAVQAMLRGQPAVSLRQLSDGFQSVIALSADIMKSLFERFSSMEEAEGIVLLDEIEAHLHPTWKIEIVDRLRKTFPRVSFIATTHDPLCLKGLHEGEIVVLRRDELQRVVAQTDVPPVNDLRADQILTSMLFGLPTTRGDDATRSIARYAELSEKRRPTSDERDELSVLRIRLDGTLTTAESPLQRQVEAAVHQTLVEMARAPRPREAASRRAVVSAEEYELRRQLNELLGPAR